MELSGGLLDRPDHTRTEAEIRHQLITPLLRRIAHSLSSLKAPEGCTAGAENSSGLHFEAKTQEWANVPGAKPCVDYLLTGQMEDKYLYLIPVEVKKEHNVLSGMGQLAQYMSSLGKGMPFLDRNTSIGLVVDNSTVHFVFAPYMLNSGVHLPIVLISPAVSWRVGIMWLEDRVWPFVCFRRWLSNIR